MSATDQTALEPTAFPIPEIGTGERPLAQQEQNFDLDRP